MKLAVKLSLSIYLLFTFLFLIFHSAHISYGTTKNDAPSYVPLLISVYRTETGSISTLPLEKYIQGVVANEMPAGFHIEALKAQAVAARTYAVSKVMRFKESHHSAEHPAAPLCDSTHCQVYADISKSDTRKASKIQSAVDQTRSQMLYYNDSLAEYALFHSSSGGVTENCQDVFVSAVPYLISVESPYEATNVRSGHGVGMSQYGANGMAEKGYTYDEILYHYYQGISIR